MLTNNLCLNLVCAALLCTAAIAQTAPVARPASPAAQVRLGNDYLDKKDYSSAMTWFRKAAEQGDPAAENNIGWLCENGWGVQQDYAEAMNWFRKAAGQGYAIAQTNIGFLYQRGWGVSQD